MPVASPHAECQAPLHRRRERVSQDANLADPRCSAEGSDPTFLSALQRALHLQSPLHGTQLSGQESSVARTLPRVHKIAAAEVQRAEDAQPDEDPVAHRERHRAPSWMRPPVACTKWSGPARHLAPTGSDKARAAAYQTS